MCIRPPRIVADWLLTSTSQFTQRNNKNIPKTRNKKYSFAIINSDHDHYHGQTTVAN
eukprot:m.235195 g.235195  ORF g.235195 m.235195 type:complete len:57 (+) comp33664_c1_seq33:1989-2159(+)